MTPGVGEAPSDGGDPGGLRGGGEAELGWLWAGDLPQVAHGPWRVTSGAGVRDVCTAPANPG